ncbi:MAG: DUF5052 family protein [Solirubrobacterales bacterium]
MNRLSKITLILLSIMLVLGLSGCAKLSGYVEKIQGKLIGDDFKILSYDDYGNNTLTAQGRNINIGLFKNFANSSKDSTGFKSEVLEITVEGKQLLHVGSTMVFAEKGVDMIKDYDITWMQNAVTKGQGTFVPLDRTINSVANLIGKKKTIIVRSQMGIIIGVYQGNEVMVEVPSDLPKTTRIIIDGKSLYIYAADYDIFDTGALRAN